MLRSDFLVHNEVRRELARTQANLGRIHFGVTRGVIYFGGEFWVRIGLKKVDGQKYFGVLVGTLVGLEKRLRRIPGVTGIFFRFSNIEKQGGFWRRASLKMKSTTAASDLTRTAEVPKENQSPNGRHEEG